MTRLYGDLADWWPLVSPPEEYAEEAALYLSLLAEAGLPGEPALLELGSGGGSNAFHMRRAFAHVTLTDLSPAMLAVSRALNPGVEHVEGDMRGLRLGRAFDAVFVHDAVGYMTTARDLQRAMATAFAHCRAGGVALFAPDHVRETFRPAAEHHGRDGDGRALRYLEWAYDPDPADTSYLVEYAFLLREGPGPARVVHDRHVLGLFPRAEWLRLLAEAGFRSEARRDPYGRDLFLGRRP